jgi:hypothetical protein
MEYKHLKGQAYCRYASTPPIINSPLAYQYGVEIQSMMNLEEGRNVKLRVVLEDRSKRMTCHASIDYVQRDESIGQWRVGFSNLSLNDVEFRLLLQSFVDKSERILEFGDTVRDKGVDVPPVTEAESIARISRMKAVNLPVLLIEEIDMKRGEVPFSEFVIKAVEEYLKR